MNTWIHCLPQSSSTAYKACKALHFEFKAIVWKDNEKHTAKSFISRVKIYKYICGPVSVGFANKFSLLTRSSSSAFKLWKMWWRPAALRVVAWRHETNQMHINRVLLNIVRENMDHREIFVLAVEVRWKIHQRIWDLSFKDDEQKKKTRFSISSISQQYLVEMPSQFPGFPSFSAWRKGEKFLVKPPRYYANSSQCVSRGLYKAGRNPKLKRIKVK